MGPPNWREESLVQGTLSGTGAVAETTGTEA